MGGKLEGKEEARTHDMTIKRLGIRMLKVTMLTLMVTLRKLKLTTLIVLTVTSRAYLGYGYMFMNKISMSQTCLYNYFPYKKATRFLQKPVTTEGIWL